MAPRATAVIILAAAAATVVVSASVDVDRTRPQQPQNTHRQRQQPVATRLLAWGQHRSRGRDATDSNRNPIRARRPTWEEEARAAAAPAEADGSWTHAAFRAFHELRAGLPASAAVGEEVGEDDGRGGTTGPFEGVRRFAVRLQRSMGETLGPKARDEHRENQVVVLQAENGTSAQESHSPAACWHMKGRLTNAETGQTIALVEGVELSRSLAFETASAGRRGRNMQGKEEGGGGDSRKTAGKNGGLASVSSGGGGVAASAVVGGELEVDKALKPGMWTAFGALASSKFFMYQDPDTGEPMEYFRNTPVEKKQTVRTYERFSQIVSHLLQPNGRVLVVSEWGGRSVKAETANSNGVEEIEGGGKGGLVGRGGGGSPRRVFNLHFFVQARTPKEEREVKKWEDRPMARWVAFGPTPPRAHGCKEIYSYVTGGGGGDRRQENEPKPRDRGAKKTVVAGGGGDKTAAGSGGGLMSYTRYGECPTWYGTGRMCGLDVQAKRVGSFGSLPAKLRQRVLEVDPEFEAGPPGSMEDCRKAAARERGEREEERRRRRRRSLRRPFGAWGSGGGGAL